MRGSVSWAFVVSEPDVTLTTTQAQDFARNAGNVAWSFDIPEATVTHTPVMGTDHSVNAGNVSWSFTTPEVTVTLTPPATTVPDQPTGLAVTATHNTVSLSWDDPNNNTITSYQILRRDITGGSGFAVHIDSVPAGTSYNDTTDVAASNEYRYRIKARNAQGVGPQSDFVSITTDATPPPGTTVTAGRKQKRPTSQGQTWSCSCYVRLSDADSNTEAKLVMRFLDSSESVLDTYNTTVSAESDDFELIEVINKTAPANTAWVEILLEGQSRGNRVEAHFSNIMLDKSATAPSRYDAIVAGAVHSKGGIMPADPLHGFWELGTEGNPTNLNWTMLQIGDIADRPAASSDINGASFIAIDEGKLYLVENGAWVEKLAV